MPRGFVNRRDRFRWDNVHFPDGENPLSSDSVTYGGQTLTQALDRLEEGVCFVEATPGASVTFMTADAAPLKSLKVAIVPTQSGSGDPSPDNVRPISGSTKCTVQVGDGVNTPTDYEIAFGADVGTVYGGTLDVVAGTLTVDMAIVKLSSLGWVIHDEDTHRFRAPLSDMEPPVTAEERLTGILATSYKISDTTAISNMPDLSIMRGSSTSAPYRRIYLRNTSCTTADELIGSFTTADELVYKLAEPHTYTLTQTEIETLIGTNVVTADTGDITELIFKDTFSNEVNLIWQAINDLDARVSALEGNKSITLPPDDQKKAVTEEEPAEEIVEEQPVKKTTRKKSTNNEKEE